MPGRPVMRQGSSADAQETQSLGHCWMAGVGRFPPGSGSPWRPLPEVSYPDGPVGWSHRDPHGSFFQPSETPAVPKKWPLLSLILAPAATHTGHCCIHSSLGGCISSHSNQGQGSSKKRGCLSKVSWGAQGHSQSVCSSPGDEGMEKGPGRETDSALNSRWGEN